MTFVKYLLEGGEPAFVVDSAKDGDEGMELINEKEFDLVLLDVMLPGADGFAICREIRRNSICPIIFLTARGREEDILHGYQLGCDDYIVKPFSLAELFAKVNAMLKRAKEHESDSAEEEIQGVQIHADKERCKLESEVCKRLSNNGQIKSDRAERFYRFFDAVKIGGECRKDANPRQEVLRAVEQKITLKLYMVFDINADINAGQTIE